MEYTLAFVIARRAAPDVAIRSPPGREGDNGLIYLNPPGHPFNVAFPCGKAERPIHKAGYQPLNSL